MSEPLPKTIARLTAALPDEYADTLHTEDRYANWHKSLRELLVSFFPTPESPAGTENAGMFYGNPNDPLDLSALEISEGETMCVRCTMIQRQLYPQMYSIVVHTPAQRATTDYQMSHEVGYAEVYDYAALTPAMSPVDQKSVMEYVLRSWTELNHDLMRIIIIVAHRMTVPRLDDYVSYDHRPESVSKAIDAIIDEGFDIDLPRMPPGLISEFRDEMRERNGLSTNALSLLLSRVDITPERREYLTEALAPVEMWGLVCRLEQASQGTGSALRYLMRYRSGSGIDEWPNLINYGEETEN